MSCGPPLLSSAALQSAICINSLRVRKQGTNTADDADAAGVLMLLLLLLLEVAATCAAASNAGTLPSLLATVCREQG